MTLALASSIAVFVSTIVGVVLKVYTAVNRSAIDEQKAATLDRLADIAILSAEEAGGRNGDVDKRIYAAEILNDLVYAVNPKLGKTLTTDLIENLIDAAIAGAGLGHAGKQ